MANYRVISSDSHVVEPPDLWTTRMGPRYRDRAPKVVSTNEGDFWVVEGRKSEALAGGSQAGKRFEDPGNLSFRARVEEVRPGGYIPDEQRCANMGWSGR